jgi:hypothetical protein
MRKKTRSWPIANIRRPPPSMNPLRHPNVEIITSSAINAAPVRPQTISIVAAATRPDCAPEMPRANAVGAGELPKTGRPQTLKWCGLFAFKLEQKRIQEFFPELKDIFGFTRVIRLVKLTASWKNEDGVARKFKTGKNGKRLGEWSEQQDAG